VSSDEPQGDAIARFELAVRCKELGSSSEVKGFRLEVRDRLLIESSR
jgi:hypothetical protein